MIMILILEFIFNVQKPNKLDYPHLSSYQCLDNISTHFNFFMHSFSDLQIYLLFICPSIHRGVSFLVQHAHLRLLYNLSHTHTLTLTILLIILFSMHETTLESVSLLLPQPYGSRGCLLTRPFLLYCLNCYMLMVICKFDRDKFEHIFNYKYG